MEMKNIMSKEAIKTPSAPESIGAYSQAIKAGDFLYLSGQLPLDARTGEIKGNNIRSQARHCIVNISSILRDAGLSLKDVVKTTVFIMDINDFPALNEVYTEHFSAPYPARSTIQVSALPRQGAMVEIEAVAYMGNTTE